MYLSFRRLATLLFFVKERGEREDREEGEGGAAESEWADNQECRGRVRGDVSHRFGRVAIEHDHG